MEVLTNSSLSTGDMALEVERLVLVDHFTTDIDNIDRIIRACERNQFSNTPGQERRIGVTR